MDTTGKLPGGMVTVAVAVIILMAVVVPVVGGMASTLTEADGRNDLASTDRAVLAGSAAITISSSRSTTVYVTVDGSDAVAFTSGFYVFSPSAVVQVTATGAEIIDMSSGSTAIMEYPITVAQTSSGLVIADGQEHAFRGNPWILYSYAEGLPAATHAASALPAIVGEESPMVGVNYIASGDDISNAVVYEDGRAKGIGGTVYEVTFGTAEADGQEVRTVEAVTGPSERISLWYVPYEWHFGSGNALIRTLVTIVPVLLAAAIVVSLSVWMFPRVKGGKDDVFSSR